MILQFLLYTIIILSIINICIIAVGKNKELFEKVLLWENLFVLVHISYVFIIGWNTSKYYGVKQMVPFPLIYGPLLYLALRVLAENKLNPVNIVIHFSPFIFSGICFIFAIFKSSESFDTFYTTINGVSFCLSFGGYAIWGMNFSSNNHIKRFFIKYLFILSSIILLIFLSFLTAVILFNKPLFDANFSPGTTVRFLMYTCFLVHLITVFYYLQKREKIQREILMSSVTIPLSEPQKPKYSKSLLKDDYQTSYVKRLENLMSENQIFLDPDLSIEKLAKLLFISPHHLSQILNLNMGTTFYDFVNQARVEFACELIRTDALLSVESLARQSGFNSRISFNRQFKVVTGMTPTQFKAHQSS
ncbi:helix-turn-helix domain-containing protein [Pedobacter jamesrossensis]|uniref:Helix-turn-helix domain-containing protein n=1 Tax=Pedobacter jamesrossensis TaxID=1908238 RepID=A0ABV8NLZ0_9SPHI